LYVSFAENACGTNGASEEALRLAVRFEYVCLGIGLVDALAKGAVALESSLHTLVVV
jgi:hypothetical protein